MTNAKSTKRALLLSILSMMLCVAMLVGSTFAWFTDSVSSGKNKIVAGNLDVELEYATEFNEDGSVKTWTPVTAVTELFSALEKDGVTENLWEPGHTEYVCLRVRNAGTLALKYQFDVNVWADEEGKTAEKTYINKNGDEFKLSEHLVFTQTSGAKKVANRQDLWITNPDDEKKAMGDLSGLGLASDKMLSGEEEIVTLAVYMPTQVGNEANYKVGKERPEIYLGLSVIAAQTPSENDSFGNTYDTGAKYPGMPEPISEVVDIGAGNYILEKEITNDYNTPIKVTEGEAIIDLNGNHVGALNIMSGATLTVKDSVGGGNADRICFEGGGTFLLESGEVTNIVSKSTTADNKATATINGGTISGIISAKQLTCTINDGNFTCADTEKKLVFANNTCLGTDATINGGTFAGYIQLGTPSYDANLTINGGTYNESVYAGYGTVTITGGTFNNTVGLAMGSTATLSITGGTFKNDPSTYVDGAHIVTKEGSYFVVTPKP